MNIKGHDVLIGPYETNRCYFGDVPDLSRALPDESVHCIVTSPPYWGLRSYLPEGHPDKAKEIGTEATPEEYVARLVEIFRELRRALRKDGTLWLNLGDTYVLGKPKTEFNAGGLNWQKGSSFRRDRRPREDDPHKSVLGLKPKDLIGIPWMVAFALRADGWWLRMDNVWEKPNPMPESVTDRTTKAHEYMFHLSKSDRYYYDNEAVKEASKYPDDNRKARQKQQDLR